MLTFEEIVAFLLGPAIERGMCTKEEVSHLVLTEEQQAELRFIVEDALDGPTKYVCLPDCNLDDWRWQEALMRRYHKRYDRNYGGEIFSYGDIVKRMYQRDEKAKVLCFRRRMTMKEVKKMIERRCFLPADGTALLACGPEYRDGKHHKTYTVGATLPVPGKSDAYRVLCVWRDDDGDYAAGYEEIGPEGFPADAFFQCRVLS